MQSEPRLMPQAAKLYAKAIMVAAFKYFMFSPLFLVLEANDVAITAQIDTAC